MNQTQKITFSGVCIALGIVLPIAFHSIPNAGNVLLPMHLPILLCGLICGPSFGLACGIATPVISSFLTGMPPAAILPGMTVELASYGFFSGLMLQKISISSHTGSIYLALITTMLLGRILRGVLNALLFQFGSYSIQIWISSLFITALPGIILQLILLPILVLMLQKAGISIFTKQTIVH